MSRQSRLKGQITPMDLLMVAMVFFIGVGLFLVLDFLTAKHVIISKQSIYLSMEIDDRGSEIISLLGATSSGRTYMEITGGMSASNYREHIQKELDNLRDTAQTLGSGYSLEMPEEKAETEDGGEIRQSYAAQVPVPGARQGKLKKTVELVSREGTEQETGEELARDGGGGQLSPEVIS
jgi:hypothetical protein